ncbi:SEC-C metal-binding domain-containing protein [Planococcus sp. ISL-109]|uniref:YecA family protein n=1 Tax=Planococcus sp. ISL-109 TaxID=2819166 RepID=UPI001BEA8BFE|nr:SEC-C metal-binding domain-containing protein [Planococcus sp. ISL-109]MBT2583963.1 SEC-C domain-containing protein [Planococcus sp. ISL-109]
MFQYADELYVEPTKEYIALRKELQPKHTKLHPLSFEKAIHEVKLAIQWTDSPMGYVNLFFEIFEGESEKDMKKYLDLLMNFANHLRLWTNRGHQPVELLPQENLRPLPSKVIEFPSGPRVGRNDPCPCGSGKKYKKCCGK